MKNKLAYLGFLGLVGLIGIPLGQPQTIAFCSFFTFFIYAKVIPDPDELFWDNARRSAFRAFIVQIIISAIALAIGSAVPGNLAAGIMVAGLSLSFAFGIIVFTVSLAIYERNISKGLPEEES